MTSERFYRTPPIVLKAVLTICACATALTGPVPFAHAQGGANGARKGAESARHAERAAAPAESSASDKARRDAAAGDAGSAAYREYIDQALSEFKLENWPEARLLFRRAHELNPSARTLRGIGMVSFEMREYVPAIVALTDALADTRQPLTPAQRKECEALLARANTFISTYALSLTPANLTLTVDGAPAVLDAEGRLMVAFGEHALEASAPEYDTATKTITVQGGETTPLEIALRRTTAQPLSDIGAAEAPAAPHGTILVGSNTPQKVTYTRQGGLRYTWVALGASAAFGASAISTWVVGQKKFDTLKDQCDAAAAQGAGCVRGETDVSKPERLSRATNVLLGLSAASLVTAVVLLPFEWPRERRLALGVGPSHLSIRGSF